MSDPKTAKEQALEKINPLPAGPKGLQGLRSLKNCVIPEEAKHLNQLLEKALTSQAANFEEVADNLGKGLTAVMLADYHCKQHKTQRPVVRLNDDDELRELNAKIKEQGKRFGELQQEMMALSQALQADLKQRWFSAVKKYGLAPEKYTYEFDEDKGVIYLVDLDCAQCQGPKQVQDARLQLADALVRPDKKVEP